jgi:uncharacterized protein YdaU (DUF1376 family)
MQKPPAFQFYAKDWLTGTLTMSLELRGLYITLLAYQWDHGGIPADMPDSLAKIAQTDAKTINILWPFISKKFHKDRDNIYRNSKLKRQWKQVIAYRKAQSLNGMRGGRRKKGSLSSGLSQTKAKRKPNESSSSSSSVRTYSPPTPPPQEGGLSFVKAPTRAERKWADQIFKLRSQHHVKRCPHDPPCDNHNVCLGRMVQEKRQAEAAGQRAAR